MIRLAVSGEEGLWQAVSARLRGSTVERFDPQNGLPPADSFDALLITTWPTAEATRLQECLASKPVLISADCWLSQFASIRNVADRLAESPNLSIANIDHHLPSRQLIQQQIAAGKLGAPGLIRIHRWQGTDESITSPDGTLAPLVLDVELAGWLAGAEPELIYATEASGADDGPPAQRVIQVHLGFPGGAMALIDYVNALPTGDGYQSLSVIGGAGAVYADDHRNVQLLYRGGPAIALPVGEELRQWTSVAQEFADAVRAGAAFSPATNMSSRLTTIAAAVQQSLASRQAVNMTRKS